MTSAGREVLKWLALVLMTGDHVNKVLFAGELPYLTEAARVVFPIFAIVLAYNLALNPDPQATKRALRRMLVFAVIAQPFHAWAFGYMLPVNVLFTLALGVYVATERRIWLATLAGIIGGAFVDYQWFGVGVIVAAHLHFRGHLQPYGAALLVGAVASLHVINDNLWALAAFPAVLALRDAHGRVPRWRWTFLAYYVGHLAVLVALAPLVRF